MTWQGQMKSIVAWDLSPEWVDSLAHRIACKYNQISGTEAWTWSNHIMLMHVPQKPSFSLFARWKIANALLHLGNTEWWNLLGVVYTNRVNLKTHNYFSV